ncbi:MAG: XrtA-associated tyrosine autokinase [Pseudomonadota bacterium]|nr:XrtA-associated tyrosine autokinase [Pseudomonadota bacterium]
MNTIEQAAHRLAQLRSAGVDPKVDAAMTPEIARRELDRDPAAPRSDADREFAAPIFKVDGETGRANEAFASPQVNIDLERLSAMGYISPHAPSSRRAEEFRMVKRPLLNNARGNSAAPVINANRIMVTSALPREGKTFIAINLAISIALERDTTVLLIDADATRPAVLERLALPPAKGLLDVLSEPDLDVQTVVLRTNVERLSILPAGTLHQQATELLASKRMSALVDKLAARFPNRVLLFDAPPLLGSTESRVLAAHMGQIVLVIEADSTPHRQVNDALVTLESCPVVMTLLNKASSSEAGSYYGSRTD